MSLVIKCTKGLIPFIYNFMRLHSSRAITSCNSDAHKLQSKCRQKPHCQYPEKIITDLDYAGDLTLLSNTIKAWFHGLNASREIISTQYTDSCRCVILLNIATLFPLISRIYFYSLAKRIFSHEITIFFVTHACSYLARTFSHFVEKFRLWDQAFNDATNYFTTSRRQLVKFSNEQCSENFRTSLAKTKMEKINQLPLSGVNANKCITYTV